MPGQTLIKGEPPHIGIVIEETDERAHSRSWKRKRVGIMWNDNLGQVDWEPRDWLEVIK
tara:strand:+ start:318 stop:494 length:177 start_codon:yes stop_codon:yes gene_type:complete